MESSEALLGSPLLAAPENKTILILSGAGGRTLLRDRLRQQGAEVVNLNVYRRLPLTWKNERSECLKRADIVILSSGETIEVFRSEWRRLGGSSDVILLVPNERIEAIARQLGFHHVLLSDGAGKEAVVNKLLEYYEGAV